MILLVIFCAGMASTALAASKSSRVSGSKSYTITTGKKDATLTITQSAGKAQVKVLKNALKQTYKTTSKSIKGKYKITVTKGWDTIATKTLDYPFDSKVTIKLPKNGEYTATVEYISPATEITASIFQKWTKYPAVKLSTNNSAKIK